MKKTLSLLIFFAVLCIGCTKTDDGGTDKKNDNPTGGISYVGDVAVTQDDGTDFIKKDVEVVMTRTENTMKMEMLKVSFAAAMPIELDMTVEGISFRQTSDGYAISGDNLVPTAMGGAFPAYTITNLAGGSSDGRLTFSTMCGHYPLRYSGRRQE